MDFFSSRHGSVKIAYSKYLVGKSRYKLVFLTGRAEFITKYEPLFKILNDCGISVYAMDHRGQGASGRILNDPHKGHVEKFSHYVDDVEDFIEKIVKKDLPEKPLLSLSHSMGGAVSLLLAERNKEMFEKAVFSSPMWGINMGSLSHNMAYIISNITVVLGRGQDYLPGKKEYRFDRPFQNNRLTHSVRNYKRQIELIKNDPSLAVGGPTHLWLHESLKAIRYIMSSDICPGCPTLILQAGDDTVVDNDCQDKVIAKLGNSGKFIVEGSWHEVLYEDDIYFQPAIKEMMEFFDSENTS